MYIPIGDLSSASILVSTSSASISVSTPSASILVSTPYLTLWNKSIYVFWKTSNCNYNQLYYLQSFKFEFYTFWIQSQCVSCAWSSYVHAYLVELFLVENIYLHYHRFFLQYLGIFVSFSNKSLSFVRFGEYHLKCD